MINVGTRRALLYPNAFNPLDIVGCRLWLDFSDRNTLFTDAGTVAVSADGDAIYQTNDKSGYKYHAIQTTSNYRPLYKTNVKNGRSVSRFDGTDDSLSYIGEVLISDAKSIFIVWSRTGYEINAGLFSFIPAGLSPNNRDWASSDGVAINNGSTAGKDFTMTAHVIYNGSDGFANWAETNSHSVTFGKKYLGEIIQGAGVATSLLNGGDAITDTYAGTIQTPNGYIIGARYDTTVKQWGAIDVCEIIAYATTLSVTDRLMVETYLNAKWGIY